ncbi:MmgE/PrpD family protein [Nocardioides sp. TF02-7]|uniref:MmgE/PrpD family protein n=1 Tax=Nocardioides sp. TF02-7 TaxID=2917724 RepID=UPI001F059EFC|nr:MmgE/PrpD family protein [Nocardioides sp. TF02-7]UMG93695.1 MmgE/PrpD family protein [Nocardioides sp. TF02-7]
MIAEELAAWATGPVTVPDAVRACATRHLVDGTGTALAAVRLGAAEPAVTVARGLGGPAEATIIGTDARVSAPAAALANGTLVHALDFDDTHAGGLVHATAVVLPAALAVGQERAASGREVLDAAVVGYEVACRVAAAAPHRFHARGLHATMVAGVFSSAAVAARLYGLSPQQATAALGIAGSQAGGLLAFLGSAASTKQLHPGMASHAGVLAARLAAAGATGPETVFDGPHGVFDALAGGQADPASIVAGLGSTWETERIGIKPYPRLPAEPRDRRRRGRGPGGPRLHRRRRRRDRGRRPPRLRVRRLRRLPRPHPPGVGVRREVLPALVRRRVRRRRLARAGRVRARPAAPPPRWRSSPRA